MCQKAVELQKTSNIIYELDKNEIIDNDEIIDNNFIIDNDDIIDNVDIIDNEDNELLNECYDNIPCNNSKKVSGLNKLFGWK